MENQEMTISQLRKALLEKLVTLSDPDETRHVVYTLMRLIYLLHEVQHLPLRNRLTYYECAYQLFKYMTLTRMLHNEDSDEFDAGVGVINKLLKKIDVALMNEGRIAVPKYR